MADKTTGELRAVNIGDLPGSADIYDDFKLPGELQGEAVHVTGAQFKQYAVQAVKPIVKDLDEKVASASNAGAAAQSALVGVREALNNLPEGSTLIVNDLTTGGTSAALSAEMGKVLGRRPNPNLLHNWYFANPVNQRGQTSYAGSVYTIDRWKCGGSTLTVNTAESVTLTSAVDATNFVQVIEHPERLSGRRVYMSFMYKSTVSSSYARLRVNGKWVGKIQFDATEQWKVVGEFVDLPDDLTNLVIGAALMSGGNVEFKAIKLEIGDTQTLAHQDADGNWVLNEIPDYGEELAKCQRYQIKLNNTAATGYALNGTRAVFVIPLPTSLRGVPQIIGDGTIRIEGTWGGGDNGKEVTQLTYNTYTHNSIKVLADTTGLTAGQGCTLACRGTATILIDANL